MGVISAPIERLPPDWEQLATKTDLARLGGEMAELRGEMAEHRGEVRGEMAELRGAMVTLGTDLGGKITTLPAAMESMEGRLHRRAASALPSGS